MTLTEGTRLGRYLIRSRLGTGGMGEVYLALDTRLERTVALKVLPSDFGSNKDRMRRFAQEARTASSLSHPNVAHIYEIEELDGLHFIAMEHVDGETLAQRIARSGLELPEILDIAMQVAAALSAAHSSGVTHRDIKPENIMLRHDGYVKVLDFGLAKLTERSTSAASEAPTRVLASTDPGTVMGTVRYMSPEQARGQEVDARTDLWSLGVVLFEMVTAHQPFAGATPNDVIASILAKEPPPLARYERDAPDTLEWIVTKALTKDREERYQSAKEIMIDLRRLKQRVDVQAEIERFSATDALDRLSEMATVIGGAATPDQAAATQPSVSARAAASTTPAVSSAEYIVGEIKRHKTGVVLITALLIAVLISGGLWMRNFATSNKSSRSSSSIKFTRLTSGGKIGNELITGGAGISPDGKYVVFWTVEGGKSSCYMRQVATNSLVKIVNPIEGDYSSSTGSTFSRDGEFVYFNGIDRNHPDGALFKVPLLGGTPQKILEGIWSPVTFSPDGKQVAYVRLVPATGESFLMAENADGSGSPRTLATRKLPEYFSRDGPSWSPDGRVIANGAASISEGNETATVVEVPASGGKERPITKPQWDYVSRVLWISDGSGLVMTLLSSYSSLGSQIWYVSYPDGVARRITNDLNGYGTVSLGLTSDSNTIVTVQDDVTHPIWATAPDTEPSRARQISNGKYEGVGSLALTPDGRIVYFEPTGDANEIWIMKADGTEKKQLTSDLAVKEKASVSPDGRYILFGSNRSGKFSIWRIDIDGNNQKQLTEEGTFATGPVSSPDGKWVVFQSFRSGNWSLWKVPIDGGEATQVSDKVCALPDISPDGKLLACLSPDQTVTLKWQIAILPFDGSGAVKLFDLPSSFRFPAGLKWNPDGRAITYVDDNGTASNVISQLLDGGPPRALTKFKSDRISEFAWSHDGKQIFFGRGPTVEDVVLIKSFR